MSVKIEKSEFGDRVDKMPVKIEKVDKMLISLGAKLKKWTKC